jgi:hypothetical protein
MSLNGLSPLAGKRYRGFEIMKNAPLFRIGAVAPPHWCIVNPEGDAIGRSRDRFFPQGSIDAAKLRENLPKMHNSCG